MKQILLAFVCILSLSVIAGNLVSQSNAPTTDMGTSQAMGRGTVNKNNMSDSQLRDKQRMEEQENIHESADDLAPGELERLQKKEVKKRKVK